MEIPVEFEWDGAKAAANEAKHNVSFEAAAAAFADQNRIDIDASRNEDGELRRKTIGLIEGRLFTIIYTMRGDVCRMISARRSNAKEGRIYDDRSLQARPEQPTDAHSRTARPPRCDDTSGDRAERGRRS